MIILIPVEKGRPTAPVAEKISVTPPSLTPAVPVSSRSALEKMSLPPVFKKLILLIDYNSVLILSLHIILPPMYVYQHFCLSLPTSLSFQDFNL